MTVVASPDGPTTLPSGADVLAQLLVEFEELMTALGSPISDWLNPPVDPVEVTQKLAAYDLVANEELLGWFGWHNGLRDRSQSSVSKFPLLPGFEPASIDEALRTYRMTVVDFAVPMADDARFTREKLVTGGFFSRSTHMALPLTALVSSHSLRS